MTVTLDDIIQLPNIPIKKAERLRFCEEMLIFERVELERHNPYRGPDTKGSFEETVYVAGKTKIYGKIIIIASNFRDPISRSSYCTKLIPLNSDLVKYTITKKYNNFKGLQLTKEQEKYVEHYKNNTSK